MESSSAMQRWLSGPVLAAGWIALCALFIQVFAGWRTVLTLPPLSLAVIIIWVILPALLIWGAMIVRSRAAEFATVSARLADQLDRLYSPSEDRDRRAHEALNALRRQAEELAGAVDQTVRAHGAGQAFENNAERLRDAAAAIGAQAEPVGASLARQLAEFKIGAESLVDLGGRFENSLRIGVAELTQASDRAAGRAEEVGHVFAEQGGILGQVSELALQHMAAAGEALRGRAKEISDAVGSAETQIDALGSRFSERSLMVVAAGDEARIKLEEVSNLFGQQVQQLAIAIERTVTRVEAARNALNEHFTSIRTATDTVAQRLQEMGSIAESQLAGLAATGTAMTEQGDKATETMRLQLRDLNGALDATTRRLESVRAALSDHAAQLNGATDLAVEKLRDVISGYDKQSATLVAAEHINRTSQDAAALFGKQTETMLKVADEATGLAKHAQDQSLANQQETFLRGATYMIETLQSLSVEITKALDQPVPEAIWRRFHVGERGVFIRHLLQAQERQASVAIKKKFEEDLAFRGHAQTYLDQFENLLAQARACDHLDVLGTTFVTADVGKLYLILANAVGRPKA